MITPASGEMCQHRSSALALLWMLKNTASGSLKLPVKMAAFMLTGGALIDKCNPDNLRAMMAASQESV